MALISGDVDVSNFRVENKKISIPADDERDSMKQIRGPQELSSYEGIVKPLILDSTLMLVFADLHWTYLRKTIAR